jgi:hypothetical protein
MERYNTKKYFGRYCLPIYSELSQSLQDSYDELLDKVGLGSLSQYMNDIGTTKGLILGCTALSFLVAIIYMVLLKQCGAVLAWISVFASIGFTIGIGVISFNKSK